MAGVFGYPDWLRRGVAITVNTGSAVDTMPAEYLYDPQPGLRARFVPTAGSLALTFDFGVSRAIGMVALVNTTMSGAETVRTYLNDTDPTFSSGNLLNIVRAVSEADRTRGACVVLHTSDITARYMRLLITDIAGSVIDIGSVMAMATIRPTNGMGFGATEGRRGLGVADRNEFTGAEFRVAGVAQPRYADFSLPSLTSTEYAGSIRNLIADTTPADDVAYIPDDGLTQGEINLRTVIGGIKTPGEDLGIARDRPMRGTVRFRITERL